MRKAFPNKRLPHKCTDFTSEALLSKTHPCPLCPCKVSQYDRKCQVYLWFLSSLFMTTCVLLASQEELVGLFIICFMIAEITRKVSRPLPANKNLCEPTLRRVDPSLRDRSARQTGGRKCGMEQALH